MNNTKETGYISGAHDEEKRFREFKTHSILMTSEGERNIEFLFMEFMWTDNQQWCVHWQNIIRNLMKIIYPWRRLEIQSTGINWKSVLLWMGVWTIHRFIKLHVISHFHILPEFDHVRVPGVFWVRIPDFLSQRLASFSFHIVTWFSIPDSLGRSF